MPRWKRHIRKDPTPGSTRERTFFAWFPYITGEEIVWWEWIRVKERCERWVDMTCGVDGYTWKHIAYEVVENPNKKALSDGENNE